MKNRILPLVAAVAVTFTGVTVASEKQLAYSKKADVAVMAGTNWCAKAAKITMKAEKSFFESGSAATFMPKVGKAVLPKECEQATSVAVTGKDKSGKLIWSGQAKKSEGWSLTGDFVKAEAPVVAGSTEQQPVADSSVVLNESEQQPVATSQPVIKQKPKMKSFEINGWAPVIEGLQISELTQFPKTVTLTTKKGCKFYYSGLDPVQANDYYVSHTETSFCKNGEVHGKANLYIKRKDGSSLKGFTSSYDKFLNGLPVTRGTSTLSPQGRYKHSRYEILNSYLGTNVEHQVHFIAQMSRTYGSNNRFELSEVIGVTANEAAFENEASIKEITTQVIKLANDKVGYNGFTFTAVNHFPTQTWTPKESGIYAVKIRRGVAQINNGVNYAYKRKIEAERQAKLEQERRERLRIQRAEEMNYAYNSFRRNKESAAVYLFQKELKEEVSSKISIDSIHTRYSNLNLRRLSDSGKSYVHTQMVKVSSVSSDKAQVEWPYPITLTGELDNLSEGWNLVYGELSASEEIDDYGLLTPVIELEYSSECKKDGCSDYIDAEEAVRIKFEDPEWSKADIEETKGS